MTKRKTENQMDRPNQKGCRNESGKLGRNRRKQEVGKPEAAEDSSVIPIHIFGNDLK